MVRRVVKRVIQGTRLVTWQKLLVHWNPSAGVILVRALLKIADGSRNLWWMWGWRRGGDWVKPKVRWVQIHSTSRSKKSSSTDEVGNGTESDMEIDVLFAISEEHFNCDGRIYCTTLQQAPKAHWCCASPVICMQSNNGKRYSKVNITL